MWIAMETDCDRCMKDRNNKCPHSLDEFKPMYCEAYEQYDPDED